MLIHILFSAVYLENTQCFSVVCIKERQPKNHSNGLKNISDKKNHKIKKHQAGIGHYIRDKAQEETIFRTDKKWKCIPDYLQL